MIACLTYGRAQKEMNFKDNGESNSKDYLIENTFIIAVCYWNLTQTHTESKRISLTKFCKTDSPFVTLRMSHKHPRNPFIQDRLNEAD